MDSTEIEKIYAAGAAQSHTAGLKAVFDAGVASVVVPEPVAAPVMPPPQETAKKGRR